MLPSPCSTSLGSSLALLLVGTGRGELVLLAVRSRRHVLCRLHILSERDQSSGASRSGGLLPSASCRHRHSHRSNHGFAVDPRSAQVRRVMFTADEPLLWHVQHVELGLGVGRSLPADRCDVHMDAAGESSVVAARAEAERSSAVAAKAATEQQHRSGTGRNGGGGNGDDTRGTEHRGGASLGRVSLAADHQFDVERRAATVGHQYCKRKRRLVSAFIDTDFASRIC